MLIWTVILFDIELFVCFTWKLRHKQAITFGNVCDGIMVVARSHTHDTRHTNTRAIGGTVSAIALSGYTVKFALTSINFSNKNNWTGISKVCSCFCLGDRFSEGFSSAGWRLKTMPSPSAPGLSMIRKWRVGCRERVSPLICPEEKMFSKMSSSTIWEPLGIYGSQNDMPPHTNLISFLVNICVLLRQTLRQTKRQRNLCRWVREREASNWKKHVFGGWQYAHMRN